jgi:hypothetical protein
MSKYIDDAYCDESTPSEIFGANQGRQGYDLLLEMYPHLADKPVPYIAEHAVRSAMITEGNLDIDIDMATNAVIQTLEDEIMYPVI